MVKSVSSIGSSTSTHSVPQKTVASESLHIGAIEAQLSFLKGEILTIVDAAFSDETQRKAVKDLVRDRFKVRSDWFREIAGAYPSAPEQE